MNIALSIVGAALMIIGGYIIGSQAISAMDAAPNITHEITMLAFIGLALDGLGFFSFCRGFYG